jgi:hypothetical protein
MGNAGGYAFSPFRFGSLPFTTPNTLHPTPFALWGGAAKNVTNGDKVLLSRKLGLLRSKLFVTFVAQNHDGTHGSCVGELKTPSWGPDFTNAFYVYRQSLLARRRGGRAFVQPVVRLVVPDFAGSVRYVRSQLSPENHAVVRSGA